MSSTEVCVPRTASPARKSLFIASLLCATALAGCSADLGRLSLDNSTVSDKGRQRTALLPSEGMRRSNAGVPDVEPPAAPSAPYAYNPAPYQPSAPPPSTVRTTGLPEPVSREPSRRDTVPYPARAPITAPEPSHAAVAGGATIEVQQGDTLYGIAKRHRVSISALMTANNLSNPMIKPGQRLVLPGGRRQTPAKRERALASAPPPMQAVPAPTRAPSPPAGNTISTAPAPVIAAAPPAEAAPAPSGWTGTHTVTPRDSLYAIARRYNVKVAELQSANGITDPSKMRAGTVLKVPASSAPAVIPASETAASLPPPRPTIINAQHQEPAQEAAPAPERVAAVTPRSPVMTDASPEPSMPAPSAKPQSASIPGKFRWPVKGRVIAGFGPRGDNTHNDGINILVPQGTSVAAAEAGTVAYAGSELKGYGNLVLIRHEGNWVSAYAHNDTLLVKRGDKVERGQAIAKAGRTGAVDQPQVHFELRKGSKPVDPTPHLEK